MPYFVDLHIHSYFSRATSKDLNLEHLHQWGQIKGLSVVATGDITHPKWLQEMQTKLIEAEEGLFRLRPELQKDLTPHVPAACRSDVRFILSGEISTIYKKNDKVRKVHSVVFLPTLAAVSAFQKRLERIGNISSDGRPILGLDTRDLLEILLETDPNAHLIPAHIWTPWFSIFGSKSGFDSIEECFGDLTPQIFALETGLSSDPPMNWRLSLLDKYALVSNSDAHSPAKLAREANMFNTELSYSAFFEALKNRDGDGFAGTVEFFPEEGKYHADGHRKCNLRMTPAETLAHNGLCPVCGSPAVLGVSYRVEQLADRPIGYRPERTKPFISLIPLTEVLSEVYQTGAGTKRVEQSYQNLLNTLGAELTILIVAPLSDIQSVAGDLTAEAIRRMREGRVFPEAGYDGEYGVIRIFQDGEREEISRQGLLFDVPQQAAPRKPQVTAPQVDPKTEDKVQEPSAPFGLNAEQQKAVEHRRAPLIISAGPGTGKTHTLIHRLAALIETSARPDEILAFTFTHRAAEEMRERLNGLIGKKDAEQVTIRTFHAFGASLLREQRRPFWGRDHHFTIIDARQDDKFRAQLSGGDKISNALLEKIAVYKGRGYSPESLPKEIVETESDGFLGLFERYEKLLIEQNSVDFEDLIVLPLRLLSQHPDLRREYLKRYPVIAVDEFQDLNRTQYELFRLLAISARDVCVIGDPDQAIYGFRGADPQYFARFMEDFPHAVSIRLARNYRSTQNILSASMQMLKHRQDVDSRLLWSNIQSDIKISIDESATERAEAELIVQNIEQLVGGTAFFSYDSRRVTTHSGDQYSFSDFAVLIRSRRLAPPLVEALGRSGIPFYYGDDDLLINEPLLRLFLAVWRNMQDKNSALVESAAAEYFPPETIRPFMAALTTLPDTVGLSELMNWIKTFVRQDDSRDETLRLWSRLQSWANFFKDDPERFFDALVLRKRIDQLDVRADRVRLLTLHASKGLEFSVVFIVGCEEGILPHYAVGRKNDIEEERRLFYVGMTRARRHLFLSCAKTRIVNGQKQIQEPSRFINGISESLLRHEKNQFVAKKRDQQMSLF